MKNKIYKTLKIMALILFVFSMLFPILYALSTSFMTTAEIESFPTKLIPSKITFDNFKDAFRIQPIMHYVKNSFIITFMTVFINLIIGSMAAYALTRTNIKFKKVFLIFVLTITLLPSITIINPIFQMYSKLNLLNTYYGLALIVAVLDLPMTIWFLSALFKDIPIEFEESAEIDGANLFQKFIYILIPIVKSGLFSIGILVFINAWNQFLIPQVLNTFQSHRTVVVGLTMYQIDEFIPFGTISAASMVTMLPIIIMVLFFQKRIIGGVLKGGLKG